MHWVTVALAPAIIYDKLSRGKLEDHCSIILDNSSEQKF